MRGPSGRVIVLCLLLLHGACAVRKVPESGRGQEKRQTPARRASGYTEEGLAGTLQGTPAQAVRGMVAAHKTLPMSLMVRVTNPETGKSAVVRITRRGPFVKGRIIDLSPAAAGAIGMQGGAAVVKLDALGFRRGRGGGKDSFRQPDTYDAGRFSVQVMTFADAEQARILAEKLKRLFGYSEIRAAEEGGRYFYRVLAGQYQSLRGAQDAEKNFTEYGYPTSFVLALD